jgi:K+-sensing histidine kinase KdpD
MSELLPFSSRPDQEVAEFDLGDLVSEVGESLEADGLRGAAFLDIDIPPYTTLRGNRLQIRRLLQRLILNALQVTPRGGSVVITATEDADGVDLEIADSDSAFAAEANDDNAAAGEERRLWPPAWAELQKTLAEHGGWIEVTECPDGGAAFTLRFPRTTGEQPRTRRAA